MKKTAYLFLACLFLISLNLPGGAQEPKKKTEEDWVVELKTVLVELRAVVTDRQGRLVEGLTREDFEVREKGRLQDVGFFSELRTGGLSISQPVTVASVPDSVETSLRPGTPVRSVLLMVDTIHMSPSNVLRVKQSLKKFIDEQITDQDTVMLLTSSGMEGIPARFTRDRAMLRHFIDRIAVWGSTKSSYFSPYLAAAVKRENEDAIATAIKVLESEEGLNTDGLAAQMLRQMAIGRAGEVLAMGDYKRTSLLNTLQAAFGLMAHAPGQRLMFFYSDGFSMVDSRGNTETRDVQAAISRAVRSGVVVYSINSKGLEGPIDMDPTLPTLKINSVTGTIDSTLMGRLNSYLSASEKEAQDGMNALASDTGGAAFFRTNDMNRAVQKSFQENRVFYLVGYYPSTQGEGFREVSVRIKGHPDYNVRTQKGYLASDLGTKKEVARKSPQQRLFYAMSQPLPETELNVSACADYLEVESDKAQVSIQVEIDGSHLNYHEESDRARLALDVAVSIHDRTGRQVNSFIEKIKGGMPLDHLNEAKRSGFMYSKRVELKPGRYQVRVGVLDPETESIGTAISWVEVPDLSTGTLALSSILLTPESDAPKPPSASQQWNAVRSYKSPGVLVYYLMLYNAPSSTASELTIQSEISQNEKVVYQSEENPVSSRMVGRDNKGMEIGGRLNLTLEPGFYELRLAIKDKSNRQSRRSIAFAVEP